MGALDPEMVEQPEAVVRHVAQQVGRPDRQAGHRAHHVRHGRVDLGREPSVAVVEADHLEAALGEALAELEVPVDQLHAESHHEQQRGVAGVADRLVDELDLSHVGAFLGHRPGRSNQEAGVFFLAVPGVPSFLLPFERALALPALRAASSSSASDSSR